MPDDRALIGRLGQTGVERQIPILDFQRRPLPPRQARLNLRIGQVQMEAALGNVDGDRVAVLDDGQRSAFGRLGRDVSDETAVVRAGEAAIGDQRRLQARPQP